MFSLRQKITSKPSGFTILDVVVIIIVVGFFAILIIPGLINGPSRARDATRKSDLRAIKTQLESYYSEKGNYPAKLTELEAGATPFMKKVPTDPSTKKEYIYITQGNPPGSFEIQATLENKNDKDLKSLGSDPSKGIYVVSSSN
jgi:general secretion pathway protein G